MSVSGLLVHIDGIVYFVPAEQVGFVAPIREVREGRLVMPRGRISLVDPAGGDPSRRKAAVALRSGAALVALAVDAVDLADPSDAERSLPIASFDPILRAAGSSER